MPRRRPSCSSHAAEHKRQRRREEQRRYRTLKRRAGGICPAPFDADVIELLISCGWLDPARADDRHEIGAAYYRAVIDAARDAARTRSAQRC